MNPPPIGEALSAGWNAVKAQMVPMIVAMLCAMIANLVFMGVPGILFASLKAIRGQKPEPADAFVGFQKFVDHLVLVLLQNVGLLVCCGGPISAAIFTPGTFLVLDKGLDWTQAKDRVVQEIWPKWMEWTIFTLVTGLVGASGLLLCLVGVLVTAPIATCAWAYAYEQTLAKA